MSSALKPQIEDLAIEVEGERIAVSLVGTNFRTVYLLDDGSGLVASPLMTDDSKSAVSREEFEDVAWAAATRKAFELGWIK